MEAYVQMVDGFIFLNYISRFWRCRRITESQNGRGWKGVSFSGDIQDPPGQGPVQPAVGDPASAGGLD